MCGIVGVIGRDGDAVEMLVDGLRRLEYRGYDSAGVAVVCDGRLEVRRAVGKLGELERKLQTIPGAHPSKTRFLDRVHFFGQATTRDKQGRLLIPSLLRETAQMSGSVDVLGKYNFLEIWNHERFVEKLKGEPFTEEDGHALAEFGI